MKRITIVALAVLYLATTTALVARVPVMKATRATAAPTIDGKLEDDEAHHSLPSPGQPDTGRADDADHLYIGIRCDPSDPTNILAAAPAGLGDHGFQIGYSGSRSGLISRKQTARY